jgi:hypothetical protein
VSRERHRREEAAARQWTGPYRSYDILREATVALGVVLALAIGLTVLFSSPDDPPSTIQTWSHTDPVDFVTTATTELDGSSGTGGYGPPYNHAADGQHIAFVYPAKWLGVSHPIDTAQDFVLAPLRSITGQPALHRALSSYEAASAKSQTAWSTAYEAALGKASANPGGSITVKPGNYGPLPTMMGSLLAFAQSGGLDGALLSSKQFYQTDYTKPLLFMADGGVLANRAQAQHLLGTQWGMMNETGSYPGQVWMWLYTAWYQVEPFKSSPNADALVWVLMMGLSLVFICVPFIPGLRSLPRQLGVHRVIWRDHYRRLES